MSTQALQRAVEIAGSQKALADGIATYLGDRFTQQGVSYWLANEVLVEAKYWAAIEHVTKNRVTRRHLRPDIFAVPSTSRSHAGKVA